MNSSSLFTFATLAYLAAMVLYIGYLAFKKEGIGKTASAVTYAGLIVQTIALFLRWSESYQMGIGRVPLSNLYESLVFFTWSTVLIYVIVEYKYKTRAFGAFVIPVAFLALAFINLLGINNPNFTEISPLVPALKSNWLFYHVLISFLGYAAFGVAFAVSMIYLLLDIEDRGKTVNLFAALGVVVAVASIGYYLTGLGPKVKTAFWLGLRVLVLLRGPCRGPSDRHGHRLRIPYLLPAPRRGRIVQEAHIRIIVPEPVGLHRGPLLVRGAGALLSRLVPGLETQEHTEAVRAPARGARRRDLPDDRRRMAPPDSGHHHRRGVGEQRLGHLLELGPEGDLVPHHLVRVRDLSPFPVRARVEGDADGGRLGRGVPGRDLHLPWCEPGALRAPLLRRHGIEAPGRNGGREQFILFATDRRAGDEFSGPFSLVSSPTLFFCTPVHRPAQGMCKKQSDPLRLSVEPQNNKGSRHLSCVPKKGDPKKGTRRKFLTPCSVALGTFRKLALRAQTVRNASPSDSVAWLNFRMGTMQEGSIQVAHSYQGSIKPQL